MRGAELMASKFTRRDALTLLSLAGTTPLQLAAALAHERTANPAGSAHYRLEFTYALNDLIGDLDNSERGDPRHESETPHYEWYSRHVRKKFGSWGPRPRTYLPPIGLEKRSVEWKRERVIAVAAHYIGYGYQHHHIPDWDPPAGWPWKETCVGHNGKGFDCSNFTSFVYNQGFGIRMSAAVERQAELHSALEGRGYSLSLRRIRLPQAFEDRQKILRTGDLLYIRGREDGPITHVVIWVGSIGRSSSDVPLILDSHGDGVEDDDGKRIPCGIQIRPFRIDSWYNRCASHAHRVFHDVDR